jgi:hypothetical protein
MSSLPLGQKHFRPFLYYVLLLVLNLALYWTVLGGWWTIDDPALLRALIEHGVWRQFYDPAVWRAHYPVPAPGVLTPWVYLSLGLDYRLFGLHPMGFYAHHLLAHLLLIIVLYKALEAYLKPNGAFWAAVVFSCSIPAASTVSLLQMRHYLEGMILALLSLLCFRKAIQRRALPYAILGACCYAASTTAKESYVLLPAVLLLLPGVHPWRERRYIYPFACIGLVYMAWRAYMLGFHGMFDAYDDLLWFEWKLVGKALNAIPFHFGLDGSWQLILGLISLSPFLIYMYEKGGFWVLLRIFGWMGIIFLPLMQVLDFTAPWYFNILCILLSTAAVFGIREVYFLGFKGRLIAVVACLSLSVAALYAFSNWKIMYDRYLNIRYRIEGQFVLENGGQQDMLVMPMERWWHYYESLAWLRSHVLNKGPGPIVCWNPSYCRSELQTYRSLMYSVKKKKLVSWSDPNKKPPLERLDITVNYRLGPYGEGILSWRFGPYSKGRYLMILGAMQSRVIAFGLPMPPEGRFHFNLQEPLHFVVRYEKDGRSIASPSLSIDPSRVKDEKGMTVIWHASGKS